jgi:hypothetical protein
MIIRQKWTRGYPVHKSRSIPDQYITAPGNRYYNAAGTWYATDPTTSCLMKQVTESIVYTGGLPGHTRQGANFCSHGKYLRRYTGNPEVPCLTVINKANPLQKTEYYHVHAGLSGANHTAAENEAGAAFGVLSGTAVLGGTNGQAYANETYLRLVPDLTKFSLPNDLLDWKQLGNLTKVWRKGSSLVTQMAGARLNYKFGWVPTIADLNELTKIVLDLKGTLTDFKSTIGQTISSRCLLLKDSNVKVGNVLVDGNTHRQWRGQLDRTVHGFLVYQPLPLAVFGEMDETLRTLLDSTGFELNPKILWDKIPFSFVIDWFVNIGDYLATFKHDALELPINILQTYMQYKERKQIDSWDLFNSDVSYTFLPAITPGTVSVTQYFNRVPMRPDFATFASLKTKWPSWNQAINLVSLGITLNSGTVNTFAREVSSKTGRLVSYFDYK